MNQIPIRTRLLRIVGEQAVAVVYTANPDGYPAEEGWVPTYCHPVIDGDTLALRRATDEEREASAAWFGTAVANG